MKCCVCTEVICSNASTVKLTKNTFVIVLDSVNFSIQHLHCLQLQEVKKDVTTRNDAVLSKQHEFIIIWILKKSLWLRKLRFLHLAPSLVHPSCLPLQSPGIQIRLSESCQTQSTCTKIWIPNSNTDFHILLTCNAFCRFSLPPVWVVGMGVCGYSCCLPSTVHVHTCF